MCVAVVAMVDERWDDDGVPVARLDNGRVVALSFVPEAVAGSYVLCHLGIPVQAVSAEEAQAAISAAGGWT
jgi:hydrogenase maturation factor